MRQSPLSIAILSVSSLETAKAFYGDLIGMDVCPRQSLGGRAFESHWALPEGSTAEAMLFSVEDSKAGRVLAIEFDARDRKTIPQAGDRTYRGLWNLNFYVDDILTVTKTLKAKGHTFWSEPVGYEVSAAAGQPVEVLFDGPDGLAINLVELTGDETTVIGRLRKEVEEEGKTRNGFTPVATTSHSIVDYDKALSFYQHVLGLSVMIDDVLDKPETNQFLDRPVGAKTRATFMTSSHPFGKIVLSHPLNYEVPNKIDLAEAPNIGYLAQSFLVPDLEAALQTSEGIGAELYSLPVDITLPGVGLRTAAIVRNPGSGALMELIEEDPT